MAAIRAGIITPNTKQALEEAEAREAAAQAELDQAGDFDQEELVQQARQLWRRLVEDLGKTDDIPRIRAALQDLLGEIKLFPNENGYLEAETNKGRPEAALGSITVVAGAGFEPTTFGL